MLMALYKVIQTRAKAAEKAITDTLDTFGDIVTHNVDEFATAAQGAKANTALQPGDNISELNNDAGYLTNADIPTIGNGTITITQGGVVKGTFTTNQAGDTTIEVDEGSAPVITDDTVYIDDIVITVPVGSSSASLDITSYVEADKMYFPMIQLNSYGTTDLRKAYYNYCIFRDHSGTKTVSLYKVDSDTLLSAYFSILLIPITTSETSVVGKTDGLGGTGSDITMDNYPTEDSTNAVTSGGVYEFVMDTCGNIEEALQIINSGQGSATAQEIMDATNNVDAIINSTEDEPIPADSVIIAESISELENILGDNNE